MEYYKELFFLKKKHNYDLNSITFYSHADDVIKYNNIPSTGFKIINNGFLDPSTGYIFHPNNAVPFKDLLLKRNALKNGVCVKPIIFEYIKDGSFVVHLYDDVVDDLNCVCIDDKVSLAESKPGNILRSIDDESYYIYMGLVGQFYVDEKGNGSVKKKHLALKTDFFNEEDNDTTLWVRHFTYIDFNKDKDKSYLKISKVPFDNLKIKYYDYAGGRDFIDLSKYVHDDVFDVYGFQHDYPSLLLSQTVRRLFSKDDISMTRNNVKLNYEYIGETGFSLEYDIDFNGFDSKTQTLYNVSILPNIKSTDFPEIDFTKHTYAIEVDDEKYLMSSRKLLEIGGYSVSALRDFSVFRQYSYTTAIFLYALDKVSIISPKKLYTVIRNKAMKKQNAINWGKRHKVYKVEYVLNDSLKFNLFSNHFNRGDVLDSIIVDDKENFDFIQNNKKIACHFFGGR